MAEITANEARRRKEVALAGLRELELEEKAGRLISRDEVAATWAATAAMLRDAVLRIPDMAAPQVAAAKTAAEARAILADACDHVLRTLSDRLGEAGGGIAAAGCSSTEASGADQSVAMGGSAPPAVKRGKRRARSVADAAVPARSSGRAKSSKPARKGRSGVGKSARKD